MLDGFLTIAFLAAAVVPILMAAQLYRRRPSSSLLSFLLYQALWNFQNVFATAFLLYMRFLPKTGRLGFILFNSVLLIPIHAATVVFFADFLWKWMGRRLPGIAKAILAGPFLVVLVTYGRQAFLRLTGDPAPSSFQVNAPLSMKIMFLLIVALSAAGVIISLAGRDSRRKRRVIPVAGLTAAGVTTGVFIVSASYTNFFSYILYGTVGVMANVPALIALAASLNRERLAGAGRKGSVPRLDAAGERFGLSEREREVLALVYRGRLNKEIAGELHVSLDTVKKHLYNVFKKTGVRSRLQLFLLVQDEESGPKEGTPPPAAPRRNV